MKTSRMIFILLITLTLVFDGTLQVFAQDQQYVPVVAQVVETTNAAAVQPEIPAGDCTHVGPVQKFNVFSSIATLMGTGEHFEWPQCENDSYYNRIGTVGWKVATSAVYAPNLTPDGVGLVSARGVPVSNLQLTYDPGISVDTLLGIVQTPMPANATTFGPFGAHVFDLNESRASRADTVLETSQTGDVPQDLIADLARGEAWQQYMERGGRREIVMKVDDDVYKSPLPNSEVSKLGALCSKYIVFPATLLVVFPWVDMTLAGGKTQLWATFVWDDYMTNTCPRISDYRFIKMADAWNGITQEAKEGILSQQSKNATNMVPIRTRVETETYPGGVDRDYRETETWTYVFGELVIVVIAIYTGAILMEPGAVPVNEVIIMYEPTNSAHYQQLMQLMSAAQASP